MEHLSHLPSNAVAEFESPRNPAFMVSAEHPSEVTEIFPGAVYSGKCQHCADEVANFLW